MIRTVLLGSALLVVAWGAAAPTAFAKKPKPEVASQAPKASTQSIEAYSALQAGDPAKARALAEPLAAAGDPGGQTLVAYLDERGLAGPKNLERALSLYVSAANAGYADAQFALGELAYHGDGVKKDLNRAAGWYELAAAQNQPRAAASLGRMLMRGEGVVRDPVRAAKLFEVSAKAGDPNGLYGLGMALLNGEGRAQNYADAKANLQRAAAGGHLGAAHDLGLLLNSGLAGPADKVGAMQWLTKAADGGVAEAMVALGLLAHESGTKTPSAADWFEKAANAGDPKGQFLYAIALSEGDNRPKDPKKALIWVDRAMLSSDEMDAETKAGAESLQAKLRAQLGVRIKPALR